ncbi:MAG: hypothetical protein KJ630_13080 [Proteobacteria bacterium]|nr:hypothetical protein [Pseudomonadota bacterium]
MGEPTVITINLDKKTMDSTKHIASVFEKTVEEMVEYLVESYVSLINGKMQKTTTKLFNFYL